MRDRVVCVILLIVAVALSVPAAAAAADPAEEPFMVRPFQPYSGEQWIGDAVCYGPHRDGQRPGGPKPSPAQIREDLHLMADHWHLIRLYGSTGVTETLLSIIAADHLAMKVVLGVWIASEAGDDPEAAAANRTEVDAAIRLANAYPDQVAAVAVGNETQVGWSPHPSPLEKVIPYVRQVRAGVSVPVTSADDFGWWVRPESRVLAAELDFVFTHAHPLWNGRQLDEAMPWLIETIAAVQAMHPDREVVIGETGWATAVHDQGEQARLIKGAVGEAEQRRFYADVMAWARREKLATFIFEAFDENWKGGEHPNEVEKHWGVYRADRTPKAALQD